MVGVSGTTSRRLRGTASLFTSVSPLYNIDIEIFTVNQMLENNAVLNSVELLFAESVLVTFLNTALMNC